MLVQPFERSRPHLSGIAPGPGNVGGIDNAMVDPSGIGNAARIVALPQPNIAVPAVPQAKQGGETFEFARQRRRCFWQTRARRPGMVELRGSSVVVTSSIYWFGDEYP
jgi:hypothetical protein